jgi:small conductance mechanosensitive channel
MAALVVIVFGPGVGITRNVPGGIFLTIALYALTPLPLLTIAEIVQLLFVVTDLIAALAYARSGELTRESAPTAALLSGEASAERCSARGSMASPRGSCLVYGSACWPVSPVLSFSIASGGREIAVRNPFSGWQSATRMEPVRVTMSGARAVLQVGFPNGTGINGTTETPQTNNTSESIQQNSQEAVETATRILPEWIPQWTVQVALAMLVLVLAWYGSKLLVRLLGRRVARRFRRPSVTQAVLRSIRIVVMLFAILTAAALLGVGLSNILLSVTVLTAAIGVVISPILGSIINGMFVISDQSYEIGDTIEIADAGDGTRGFVEDITFQNTKIFTFDNTSLVIPNSTIRDRDVINYSAEDSRTRLSLNILVTYEGDLARARDLIEQSACEVDTVIRDGPDIRIGSALSGRTDLLHQRVRRQRRAFDASLLGRRAVQASDCSLSDPRERLECVRRRRCRISVPPYACGLR